MAERDVMLRIEGIETFYGQSQVLFGMSLEVGAGEVVTLMGRNGMGKTTTVHSVMGLQPARAGSIVMNGIEIRDLPSYQVARAGLGLVPEGRQIFPNLSVRENLVATAANPHDQPDPWTLEKIYDMFPALAERQRSAGILLSGGEQQMLAIGRALMTNPHLLILDEATEGLAPLVRESIWRCIAGLKAQGQAILVIDKNVNAMAAIADRHYIIEKGVVVWTGDSAGLLGSEDILHRYMGV